MSDALALALEKNLALLAGAGAGKTYSLVTMTLHLLAGAREGFTPLRPARLGMVTFTDKAAAEMRARVRARLDVLVQEEPKVSQEPELRASLERLGLPFPSRDTWRSLREELGSASIGTFHSMCGQILRRAPPGSGVDASFDVLDELEARSLVLDVCERVVLDALESSDTLVRELCAEMTFSGSDFTEGLVSSLAELYGKLREEGLPAARARVSDPGEARESFDALVEKCLELCGTVREHDAKGEWRGLREKLERALTGLTPENVFAPERLFALKAAFNEDGRDVRRLKKEPGNSMKELYWSFFGKSDGTVLTLEDVAAACRTVPFESTFRALLEQVETRHAEELSRRNALDFTSLLVKTRDLLRELPDFRRQMQERFGALMVDEFQDTNRLQLELVLLLAEKREEGPRAVTPEDDLVAALPLEPAFLCVVGDRKQSIYEFRGADVSVFEVLARKIEQEGGVRDFLQHNRRSVPPLLDFFNQAFAGVLVPGEGGARPYEVVYSPEGDDLLAVRPAPVAAPVVERLLVEDESLTTTGELRLEEADALARRLKLLLAPGAPPLIAVTKEGTEVRPLRGGDVAMLFRTFNHLEVYRQALIRHGIPHRVLRGRGFYGAQEVLDLASLLSLLADSEDTLAFAAVLRSPLVGLSDASLFRLAGPEGLSLPAVEKAGASLLEALPEGERARLERFLAALPALRRERDRLGVRALLLATLELTGFREALAATPYAEQASANVEKLLALAGRRDERGTGGCVTFARELQRLVHEEPTEAQADLLEAGDPRAVQLLTIHRAKGLEWPVVVVPALGGSRRSNSGGRVLFERARGLALRPWLPPELLDRVDTKFRSPRFDAVKAEIKRRETAEYRRLLYVALTRAQDRLLLSGGEERNAADSWWCLLGARLEEDSRLRGLVEDLDARTLPEPPEVDLSEEVDEAEQEARVETAWQRVHARRDATVPESVTVEAGAVQDFIACPRRYHYVHRLGLRADGVAWEAPPRQSALYVERDSWGAPAPSVPDRVLALVRKVDFRLAGTPAAERRSRLEALAREVGWAVEEEGVEEALSTLTRFLDTACAQELAAVPGARVHRALPFVLDLPGVAPTALEGELDLLWETPEGEARGVVFLPAGRSPRGLEAHADFLAAVALAARRLIREDVPLWVGAVFLGGEVLEPEFSSEEANLQLPAERLRDAARALVEADVRGRWPGRDAPVCAGLACGYIAHCHPDAPARSNSVTDRAEAC
ncbi:ATP-dependent DNA helicase, UvrD/REP family [Cystobacter fuscus DSM 2262]|uniref:DNA 3'-5' helicase n=1 Tax=Cystobacter fuscus (strain ATCC 25194 / DSM 2262 / NBRC 100088 / M29) TaxID=1242864 RepID=S9R4A9_CYSF2|nr:UvrD-helicase domain-containing protein [Cystobacter fuscus]EPX63718.1 ATP-dependent DNA helicase, UvrD/REP family [Cystobacter fuscus DSM 2262]